MKLYSLANYPVLSYISLYPILYRIFCCLYRIFHFSLYCNTSTVIVSLMYIVHCATPRKIAALTDTNCRNESKNCMASKNLLLSVQFFTFQSFDQKVTPFPHYPQTFERNQSHPFLFESSEKKKVPSGLPCLGQIDHT